MSNQKEKGIKSSVPSGSASSVGKSWFFGIGINQYQHFENLNNAVKDVKDVLELLRQRYDLDEAITLFDEAATRTNIIGQLERLVEQITPEDKLIVYYSGHGYLSRFRNRGYWIPCEARQNFRAEYIRNSTIREYLTDIDSKHSLLISDSCFSGALLFQGPTRHVGALDELEQLPSRWAMCSGRDNEVVADGEPGANSPFAASILQVLSDNQNLKLNVGKLADQVMITTRSKYKQLPLYGGLNVEGHKGGQYVFHLRQGEEAAWASACQQDTLEAYVLFLLQFPSSRYKNKVNERIQNLDEEKRAWQIAEQANTLAAWSFFYAQYSQSRRAALAREQIERLSGISAKSDRRASVSKASQIVSRDGQIGAFTDKRDGYTYKTIKLQGKWWLAENLRYNIEASYCYQDKEEFCKKYGRLYTWEAAKKACPEGWRLPSDEEWMELAGNFGGYSNYEGWKWKDIGDPKKAYQSLIEGGSSGFAALLGGWRDTSGSYVSQGVIGHYWSGTERVASNAWGYNFNYGELYRNFNPKGHGFSVRCLQD